MAWPEKEKTNRIFCVIFNHRWPLDDGKRLRYIQVTPSGWRSNMSAGTIFKDKQLKL